MSTEQMKQCQAPATHAPAGNKMTYTPPQMEVIKMDLEGVIAGSGNLSDFTSGSTIRQSSTRRGYNSASSSWIGPSIAVPTAPSRCSLLNCR